MRAYNVSGYSLVLLHALISALLAPPALGPWKGLLFGMTYMTVLWFLLGVYVSDVLHLGIAHRALDFKDWFVQAVAFAQNTIGVYVSPSSWVRRHRKHHAHADREGDPSKSPGEGLWAMLARVYKQKEAIPEPRDPIFATWPMRLVSSKTYSIVSLFTSYAILFLLVRDWIYALALWISVRLISLWAYLIINYWSHDRRFGPRRYDDDNDSVNLTGWIAIVGSFSGSWHNNHHHWPHLARMTHDESEFDFGLMSVRWLKRLGVVDASSTGAHIPAEIPLKQLGL